MQPIEATEFQRSREPRGSSNPLNHYLRLWVDKRHPPTKVLEALIEAGLEQWRKQDEGPYYTVDFRHPNPTEVLRIGVRVLDEFQIGHGTDFWDM